LIGSPTFPDDGDLHLYTINWHPDYIEILYDGIRIEFQAFNRYVPTAWLKIGIINRSTEDPSSPR